jgi:Effector-associated domain 11/CHAT domain
MPIQDEITALISNAKLDKALEKFQEWATINDKEISNQLILLQGRLSSLKRSENLGLLSFSDTNRERNILTNSVLSMLENIGDTKTTSASSTPSVTASGMSDTAKAQGNPKTILFFGSNPSDTGKLQLEKEFAGISSSLQEKQLDFKIYSKWATKANEVQSEIVKRKPTIIHFSGHGLGSDVAVAGSRSVGRPSQEASGLIFQDTKGNSKVMDTNDLKRLFEILDKYKMRVSTVVLNACYSANQAKAIMPYVDYVVGMTTAVGDEAAIVFAKEFYSILGETGNIEMAFDLAVNAIDIDDLQDGDTPKLFPRDA